MQAGERQVAPTIDGIRKDHLARYEWAAELITDGANQSRRILDVGCGVGYGSWTMAKRGHNVHAFDIDSEAISYATEHYSAYWTRFRNAAAGDWLYDMGYFDAAVCFEMIEHVEDPAPLLRGLREVAPVLLASVPNEERFPYLGYKFHFRHYTRLEFDELLAFCGWRVEERWGQEGPQSPVERDINGRTYVVKAVRDGTAIIDKPTGAAWPTTKKAAVVLSVVDNLSPALANVSSMFEILDPPPVPQSAPESVCILGAGPSLSSYLHNARCLGGRRELADEVWAVNVVGDVVQCDRIFHMDDVRVQEIRAAASPNSNIANMVKWLKTHPGPIYTSEVHPDYPGLVEYPLEDVINSCDGQRYFNGTVPYAVAFAIHLGVKRIGLYGCDFTYPNAHDAEKGRACLEYWLGIARARGILIQISAQSTLMDSRDRAADPNALYGYDGVKLEMAPDETGRIRVTRTPKPLPTADEIEARYDHSRHPNSLVEESEGE
jgi:SAM-dependent methyltransferase